MNKIRRENSVLSHGARNEIVEKILHIFSEKNSWDISVIDISAACGTTPASLYSYFTSKDEMLQAAVMEMDRKFGKIADLPIPEKMTPEMKIKMIVIYVFDFIEKNKWAIDFIDPFSKYESTKKLIKRITQLIKKNGKSDQDIEYTVLRFLAGIHFKIQYRYMRNETPIENDIDDISKYMSYSGI